MEQWGIYPQILINSSDNYSKHAYTRTHARMHTQGKPDPDGQIQTKSLSKDAKQFYAVSNWSV